MEHKRIDIPRKEVDDVNSLFHKAISDGIFLETDIYDNWFSFREKFNKEYQWKSISANEAWYVRQFMRRAFSGIKTPIIDSSWENVFIFQKLSSFESLLHTIDHNMGATLFTDVDWTESKRKEFFIRWLQDEAIASSQIEGAVETREQAKALLMKWTEPKTSSEYMIVNNYRMMELLQNWVDEWRKLSIETLLEMQKILTEHTLDDAGKSWRFRTDADDIIVQDGTDNSILHIPPKESILLPAIHELVAFFEADYKESTPFIHPVLRWIIIHFWIWYLHPFCDGNGRTARALFYWYLMKQGYSLIPFIPISTVIRKSKNAYRDAFLWSEQDDFNITYFIKYNLEKMEIAIRDFQTNFKSKNRYKKNITEKYRPLGLNERQLSLMEFFDQDTSRSISLSDHQRVHHISYPTALQDISNLIGKNLIQKQRNGRKTIYFKVK